MNRSTFEIQTACVHYDSFMANDASILTKRQLELLNRLGQKPPLVRDFYLIRRGQKSERRYSISSQDRIEYWSDVSGKEGGGP